jgi:ABC-type nitrate/sulfonate/bicarbonate transport system permease component
MYALSGYVCLFFNCASLELLHDVICSTFAAFGGFLIGPLLGLACALMPASPRHSGHELRPLLSDTEAAGDT